MFTKMVSLFHILLTNLPFVRYDIGSVNVDPEEKKY
jgi:hypothetical protein